MRVNVRPVVVGVVVLLLLFSILPLFLQQASPPPPGPTPPHAQPAFDPNTTKPKVTTEDKMESIVLPPLAADQLDDTLRNYFADEAHADETVLVYLYANLQRDGLSWCPDCRNADRPIRSAAAAAGVRIIEAPVGERNEYKGVSGNPYRVHPQIKLRAVPTIIKWTKSGPGGRLVEHECMDKDAILHFLKT